MPKKAYSNFITISQSCFCKSLIAAVSLFAVRFLVCVADEAEEAVIEVETVEAVVAVVAVEAVESRVCFCFVCSFMAAFISFSISG